MNLIEFYPTISQAINGLTHDYEYITNAGETPYKVNNLKDKRNIIRSLESIPFVEKEIKEAMSSWLFESTGDYKMVSSSDDTKISGIIERLKIKLSLIKDIIERSDLFGKDDLLYIKLPELKTFDDLIKASNELKKAIQLPILDDSIDGDLNIVAGDQGSVILYVTVGTILAVKLVAGICWAAAVLKQKRVETKIFEAHARTLDLKNDALEVIIEAQKQQLKNLLESEAIALANKHYNHNDPETIERLKLSISSVSDLVERGAKILPMNNDVDIQKSFPDYGVGGLIESGIKQLKENL